MKTTLHQIFPATAAIMITFLMVSCDRDLLETVPTDRVSEDVFWNSPADASSAVNALYLDLDTTNIFSFDALTEIGHVNQNFAVDAQIALGVYDGTNSKVDAEWANAYKGIRATNYFLENVDRVALDDADLLARYKAEAKTLRAYQYIKLVGLFGDVPLITETISVEDARTLTRTPSENIWDFVDKELEEAAQALPLSYTGGDIGRITKGAALALKARANLWAERYQQAADAATAVINLGVYSLHPTYGSLFGYDAANGSETILARQYQKNSYPHNAFQILAPYSQQNGNSTYVPTRQLVDLYEMVDGSLITGNPNYNPLEPTNNRDNRLKFSVYTKGDQLPSNATFNPAPNSGTADAIGGTYIASTTGFNVKKYVVQEDFANPGNSGIPLMLIRYAEVLLTLAEAKLELGQLDETLYQALNQLRNGRTDVKQPSVTTRNTDDLREIIRRERTIELAFEGLHLFDIRRWKSAEQVLPGPVYGMTYVNNSGEAVTVRVVAVERNFVSRHYLWPIPQNERYLNENLTQNPGW
ncbi:RagB/SusD family nutrient uptake outer membrane protein [Olivibacter sp. SDN3]|uniref:RagB/SusD family nutrient uptake outer membrane protein n=1 Tax=Olivibacter sp. SDN3 TaxID=2764720 RepID=UPI0016511AA7|nr:RagB/SusD family nutrient uptake outer membrane protein [Olivibacter sp. SDN3]QNL48212.1 RagB/SusD family nutrient uptake outer membrane protein [Olivibacter sp. SDN3]